MQPMPPCSAPTSWWQAQASGLLLHWQLQLGAYSVGFFFFFSLLVMLPSEIPKLPTDLLVKEFPTVWKLLLHVTSSGQVSVPNSCLTFCPLYFVLPPFKENGLPFWVPGVLCQHSEVVLWKLLSIQMIFWWICWGESGLPILFLRHLGSSPPFCCLFKWLLNTECPF